MEKPYSLIPYASAKRFIIRGCRECKAIIPQNMRGFFCSLNCADKFYGKHGNYGVKKGYDTLRIPIGKLFYFCRSRYNMTRYDLADITGLSKGTIREIMVETSDWECKEAKKA